MLCVTSSRYTSKQLGRSAENGIFNIICSIIHFNTGDTAAQVQYSISSERINGLCPLIRQFEFHIHRTLVVQNAKI